MTLQDQALLARDMENSMHDCSCSQSIEACGKDQCPRRLAIRMRNLQRMNQSPLHRAD